MKKIPVMIVDDEKLVLEDLKTLVDWEKLGFEIVAIAFNGKQAWLKYMQYHPRVVFTDIRMPFMDGLELIQKLREVDSEVNLFLLTAYEDFSYARAAIKYGIKDYVIKSTLDETVFAEMLKKLRDDIEVQDKMDEIIREKELAEFFEMPPDSEEEKSHRLAEKMYCYLIVEQDYPINFANALVPDTFFSPQKEISKVILSTDFCDNRVQMSQMSDGRILVALDISGISQKQITDTLFLAARRIQSNLRAVIGKSFTVYLVDRRIRLWEMKQFYKQLNPVFHRKYFEGSGGILNVFSGERQVPSLQADAFFDLEEIQNLIHHNKAEELKIKLENIFENVNRAADYGQLKYISGELYDILRKNFKKLPEYVDKKGLSMDANAEYWLDTLKIMNWFLKMFDELIREQEKIQMKGYSRTIIKAMEYISRNYCRHDLTIREIAESVQLSAGHLCSLFKKETGKTLNHYITEIRINEAKRLLEESDMKIYEVSEAVGYQSSQYFSQIFYKMVGNYPTGYQKENRRL